VDCSRQGQAAGYFDYDSKFCFLNLVTE